jgi:hypothetical protein
MIKTIRTLLRQMVMAGIGLIGMGVATTAHADEVEFVVDAVVEVGSIAGVGVGQNEKQIVKTLLRCAINGKPLTRCGRQIILDRIPIEEIRPLSGCILDGTPLEKCAAEEVINQLPAGPRDVARCISSRQDIGQCVSTVGLDAAQQHALAVIDKLKADARSQANNAFGGGGGAMRNLIDIAEGVRQNDWIKVSIAGGAEVYKATLKAAIAAAVPGSSLAAPVTDEVINHIVDARANVAKDFMAGLKSGNAEAVGRAVTAAYLLDYTFPPCGLKKIIPDVIYDATCGNLGKVLGAVSNLGSNIVGAISDVLKEIGKLAEDVIRLIAKESNCMSPAAYYEAHHAQCYQYGAYLGITAPEKMDALTAQLSPINQNCRRHYSQCWNSGDFERLCTPSKDTLNKHIHQFSDALKEAAALYAGTFESFLWEKRKKEFLSCDDYAFKYSSGLQFKSDCEKALQGQFDKVVLQASYPSECRVGNDPDKIPSLYRLACETAYGKIPIKEIENRVCNIPLQRMPEPLKPPGQCSGGADEETCGDLLVTCNSFGSGEDAKYWIPGFKVTYIHSAGGQLSLSAKHPNVPTGDHSVEVCNKNPAGDNVCSESFTVHIRDYKECYIPPASRPCIEGFRQCPGVVDGTACRPDGEPCPRPLM